MYGKLFDDRIDITGVKRFCMLLPYLLCQLVVRQNNLSVVSMRGDRFTDLLEDQRPGGLGQLVPIERSSQGLSQCRTGLRAPASFHRPAADGLGELGLAVGRVAGPPVADGSLP